MTTGKLYQKLSQKIPASLSLDWDRDGFCCCPDKNRKVEKVLIALDVTDAVAEEAINMGADVILSHHPMIFAPMYAVAQGDYRSEKLIKLIQNGVSVMSFHTRLDAVSGGVNDKLAQLFGLLDVAPFGNPGEEIGRIGSLEKEMPLDEFAKRAKEILHADAVFYSGKKNVSRVAVLGGGGKDDVEAARAAGADTFLSGELKHDQLTDAPDAGMNLVMAGHFFTENPVCEVLRETVEKIDPSIEVTVMNSNPVKTV